MTHEYLNFGRTVYTDNWYTSVNLAHQLLDRNTHLVGTLRNNRKQNPKDVTSKKLKKGDFIAQQSDRGIVVLKWKDKRDVLVLSTKHKDTMIQTQNKFGQNILKPQIVIDYNKGKSLVDVCDLRSSYHNPLRISLKWYKKVAIEVLLNTSVLNALSLSNKINNTNIGITEFREKIIQEILNQSTHIISEGQESDWDHRLVLSGKISRCSKCYEEMVQQGGRTHAQRVTKQSKYWCTSCKIVFCIDCFL